MNFSRKSEYTKSRPGVNTIPEHAHDELLDTERVGWQPIEIVWARGKHRVRTQA